MAKNDLTKLLNQQLDEPLNDYLTVRDALKIFTDWFHVVGEDMKPTPALVSLIAFAYLRGRLDERAEK
jgi:hypothetical protein